MKAQYDSSLDIMSLIFAAGWSVFLYGGGAMISLGHTMSAGAPVEQQIRPIALRRELGQVCEEMKKRALAEITWMRRKGGCRSAPSHLHSIAQIGEYWRHLAQLGRHHSGCKRAATVVKKRARLGFGKAAPLIRL